MPTLLFRYRFILPFLLLFCQSCVPADQEVTLYAVGDIMLGRHIAKVMKSQGDDFPFQAIASTFQTADIVFGNLESIVAPDGSPLFFPEKPYNFHGSPNAVPALRKAGFHVLSLANNHAMDYGPDALAETRLLLRNNGMGVVGAGKNLEKRSFP